MLVAVNIKITSATELHSCFSVAFGIELDEVYSVACHISHKRDKVTFSHRMLNCDEFFVLDGLDGHSVVRVDILSLKWWESYTATADNSCPRSVDDIATDGADIEFRKEDI